MLCFALGLAALGFIAVGRHHRRRYWAHHHAYHRHGPGCGGPGGGGGPGWDGPDWDDPHGHGPHGHHGWHRGRGARHVMRILDTTPGQEKLIREEGAKLRERGRAARDEVRAARADVAEVLREETFDRARFDAALDRLDAAWLELRTQLGDSIGRVHETLDERQRERLADLLAKTRRGPSFGPFR
ncbi:MAG: periplasmic heavy metal sensor [Kofleriaceae bacterium]|nr:periplasmic heavy metal sensor [Kofleriaceae bacterium]